MQKGRAYAILTLKSFDDDQRIITGTASTPTPDRHGDIVEPLGLSFDNPTALLLHHDMAAPVGSVTFNPPTRDGITFSAHIPEIVEPGPLRDRVQEAWLSAKAGLFRGVSVRLMAKPNDVELLKGGGLRWLKAKILELSLVTVPANAEASIATVKSLDVATRAALGLRDDVSISPGVSGQRRVVYLAARQDTSMKPIAERTKDLENSRAAKVAAMNAIQESVDSEGRTKDEKEAEDFKGLVSEIKALDGELADLREMEEINKAAAKPVNGTAAGGSASRGQQVITVKEHKLAPGIAFTRYVICKAVAAMSRGSVSAMDVARMRYPDQGSIQEALKAAVAAATTADSTYAGPLATIQQYTGDFIDFLRPMTILGKFGTNGIPNLTAVPFNVNIKGQSSGGAAYWVGEGKLKPMTSFDFTDLQLYWSKVATIAAITQELLRVATPSAETLVRNELANAIRERLDRDFVDPDKAADGNVSPASITNGLTPIDSSGGDLDGVDADVKAIMGKFIAANLSLSSGVWIMPTSIALALSLMRTALGNYAYPNLTMTGGTFMGLPVIVSDYAVVSGSPTSHIVILANAADIYLADDGQVTVDASTEASLEMSDDPENESGTVVSMFQANMVALRAERYINWKKKRADAVAYLRGVAWGSA